MSLPALINDYQAATTLDNLVKIARYFVDNGIDGRKATARLRAIIEVTNPDMTPECVDSDAKVVWDSVKVRKVYGGNTRQDRAEAKVRAMLAGRM